MIRIRPLVAAAVVALLALPSLAAAGEPVWGKEMVAGKEFPLPFGVSAVYFSQDQQYEIEELDIAFDLFDGLPTELIRIDNEIDEVNVKFDAWLWPWLNVFAIAGELDGETRIDVSRLRALTPVPLVNIRIRYEGEVYGGGLVLAGGTDRLFTSLTAILTNTDLSGDFESSADAFVLAPRFGAYSRRGALYVGAMYQEASEEHQGTIGLPLIPGLGALSLPFEVELRQQDDWNWLLGGTLAIGERWTLQAEGGFGDRDHVDVELGFRF